MIMTFFLFWTTFLLLASGMQGELVLSCSTDISVVKEIFEEQSRDVARSVHEIWKCGQLCYNHDIPDCLRDVSLYRLCIKSLSFGLLYDCNINSFEKKDFESIESFQNALHLAGQNACSVIKFSNIGRRVDIPLQEVTVPLLNLSACREPSYYNLCRVSSLKNDTKTLAVKTTEEEKENDLLPVQEDQGVADVIISEQSVLISENNNPESSNEANDLEHSTYKNDLESIIEYNEIAPIKPEKDFDKVEGMVDFEDGEPLNVAIRQESVIMSPLPLSPALETVQLQNVHNANSGFVYSHYVEQPKSKDYTFYLLLTSIIIFVFMISVFGTVFCLRRSGNEASGKSQIPNAYQRHVFDQQLYQRYHDIPPPSYEEIILEASHQQQIDSYDKIL